MPRAGATTGIGGVVSQGGGFVVRLRVGRTSHYAGSWRDVEDAAVARDRLILALGLDVPLHSPARARSLGAASAEILRQEARRKSKDGASSKYLGVRWDPQRKRWAAVVYEGGRRYALIGYFDNEREAARMRDRVVRYRQGHEDILNFPKETPEPLSLADARRAVRRNAPHLTSRYRGVSKAREGRWLVQIAVDYERYTVGQFDDEEEAALAYDRAALWLLGPDATLNFPHRGVSESGARGPASPKTIRREQQARAKELTTSRYRGVSRYRATERWGASIHALGTWTFIGFFDEEDEAALAYDAVALQLLGADAQERLNFPGRATAPRSAADIRGEIWDRFKQTTTSRYTGVHWVERSERWSANIRVDGVHHHLGEFDNEVEAARAYDRAARRLIGAKAYLNFPRRNAPRTPSPQAGRRATAVDDA